MMQLDSEPIIQVNNLVKQFGTFKAVSGISFEVNQGEIFGFLGPNGAGKSTTIKILTTLSSPTAGKVRVVGQDVQNQPAVVRSSIGIIFQDPTLDSGLTALENLQLHAQMYHVPVKERKTRIDAALTLVELEEARDRLVKTFSGGMRRRLEIARGLLHRPRLLFLDEPTVGLDPQTRSHIWDYIRNLRDRFGTTIFMTTHYLDEAEYCDRIAIIDKGQIVALDTPAALKRLVGADVVTLTLPQAQSNKASEWLQQRLGVAVQSRTERESNNPEAVAKLNFEVEQSEQVLPQILAYAPFVGQLAAMQTRKPTLDDVFIKLTGRVIREEEGDKENRRQNLRKRGRI
jgi:ABC-2 type transport system ATP-binding protein